MRTLAALLFVGSLLAVVSFSSAQPPGGGKGGEPGKGGQPGGKGGEKGAKGEKGGKGGPGGGKAASVDDMVDKMMTFDKNGDGKLTKDEITDTRLIPLFERADADKKGALTKEELTSFFTKEVAALGTGGGMGGPGGPGGFGPPAPGQIMPTFLQDQLKLTDAQKKELDAIQKDVDTKLEKMLTDEQKKALKEIKERGPGGFGGPGSPGGGPPPKN